MNTYIKLYNLLSTREKKRAFLVIALTLIMGLIDAFGAASIMPFMSLIGNPQIIESNKLLQSLQKISGIEGHEDFTFFIGICVLLILVFSLLIKALTTYAQVKFSFLRDFTFGRKLLKYYLSQPYTWYLYKNSSDLGKNILDEVNTVVKNGLVPLINLISGLIVFVSMVCLMFVVEPKLAMIVSGIFLICYFAIYKTLKEIITRIGKEKYIANKDRYITISEVFGAIKEIKISNLEKEFIRRFSKPAIIHAQNSASAKLIGALPRYALEIVAFGGMFLVILYLLKTYKDLSIILPTIGVYAYAGYRIMPSLQLIYNSITSIKYATPSIVNLSNDFNLSEENLKFKNKNIKKQIYPKKYVALKNIKFKYPKQDKSILNNININIQANKVTGFVGFTGSGKTTLIDIILGLLDPLKGEIEIDGSILSKEDFHYWQSSIGYVPQNIFIGDETIESNIAFGFDKNEIDLKRIEKVAKIAEIHNFINNELPEKYKTIVGDRGIRLSGGQKQRLGIARALYKNPKFLILDEATSALDNITEKNLMKNIYKLNKQITIIIIAHRLTTVEECDEIFLLDHGQILDSGSYYELYNSNALFKKMIDANNNQK